MDILKTEIVIKCKKSDKLIMQLAEANNMGFRSVLHWFNKPVSQKVMLHGNLVIIANFFGLELNSILEKSTEDVHQ